jgi:formylglycine-generating enzyme required for sulfatase activity
MRRHLPSLTAAAVVLLLISVAVAAQPDFDLVDIPPGTALLGDAEGDDNEVPKTVRFAPFRMMRNEVTNAQFAAFVTASGHVSDAERGHKAYVWTDKWRIVEGARWRHPHGVDDTITGRENHPVMQVSAGDGDAFCAYYGMRLPSEDEWEYAARGRDGRRYPWGNDAPRAGDNRRANFGTIACCAADEADGYLRTAPVGSYREGASPFGLNDMAGNVWEWTSSPFPGQTGFRVLRGGGWGNNPYCLRTAYRHGNRPTTSLDMVGFRCAADME